VMDCLCVSIAFEPLGWAIGLTAVAAALVVAESALLLQPLRRRSPAAFWLVLTAALGLGVLAAWIWAALAGEATPLVKLLHATGGAGHRLVLLIALPLLAGACVLALGAMLHGLVAALSGSNSVAAFLGVFARGVCLVSLVGLILFWTPRGAVIAIGAAAIAWVFRSYVTTTSPLARWVKRVLLGLRVIAVLLLTAWALRPALEYRTREEVKTVLLVCADTSSSMARRDVAPGDAREATSRAEAVHSLLRKHHGDMQQLADSADLELVTLAAEPSAPQRLRATGWDLFAVRRPNGQATALGDALAAARGLYGDQRRKISSIVLISDGCNNTADVIDPGRFATLMGSQDVPIHTVAVGSEHVTESIKTLTVRDLAAPDEIDAFNRLPITATIETTGLQGKTVEVTCRFGQEEIASKAIVIDELRRAEPVRFVHVPLAAGFHRLVVSARPLGPAVPDLAGRQEASRLVHVVDREMRILYVEGKFRYEAKYIARALAAARRFSLDRRVLLQPLTDRQPTPLSENLDDWLAYHAIIFGDVAASRFTRQQLQIVRDLVGKYGKGFCMLGGSSSFGRGGWQDTPIADILPIDLSASAGQIDSPLRVELTRQGRDNDVMRIGDGSLDVAADWRRLDPLPGANRLIGLKPAATVLAETDQREPLIVSQPYGKGRTMAIAFDMTWRWVLTKNDTADLQRRFWRQVALFLAAPKGTVWVVTDKTNYDLRRLRRSGESIKISAGVEDSHGRPLLNIPVTVKLVAPGGQESPVSLRPAEKMRRGQLSPPTKSGTYTLHIAARVGGKLLTAKHRFEVLYRDLESLEVLANHNLLRRMSSLSRGQFVTHDRFGDLLKQLHVATRPERRDTVAHVMLSQQLRWPVVAALIALLCAEWAFRKRKGLV
jgi:uncharacterized membrane protein